jgi:cob(I)alamin adenosyltransferase
MTPDDATSSEAAPATRTIDSLVATGKGDDGTTGLLFGGPRVAKDDPRTEAYGTVDEAVAALGLARAELGIKGQYGVLNPALASLAEVILRVQRELFVVGAELATHVEKRQKLTDGVTRVTAEMVTALEGEIDTLEAGHVMPVEFVLPGESMTGASLDMARSIVRRAERRTVQLQNEDGLPDSQVVPYLNRLADLLFVMARAADGGFRPVRSRE